MKYLINDNSFTFLLADKYHVDYLSCKNRLFDYSDLKSQLCSQHQCKDIFDKVYLSDDRPFGLVDRNCLIGKVATEAYDINAFNEELKVALNHIATVPALNLMIKKLVKCFIPVVKSGQRNLRENGNGSSVHWLKGAVFLSLPAKSPHAHLELILNVVHELGHQSLMLYQDCDEIIYNGLIAEVYSSIRKTSRPAIMSFHALVAIHYMLEIFKNKNESNFWKKLNRFEKEYLTKREQELRVSFVAGAEALKTSDWTNLGKSIYTEMIQSYLHQYESIKNQVTA